MEERKQSFNLISRRQKLSLVADPMRSGARDRAKEAPKSNFRTDVDLFLNKPRTIPVPRWISPRYHTVTLSECLGHSSFILVAMSYAVDDFLTLRIVAVAGSTAMLFFTYFHPHGRILWLPFKWNLLFIGLNSYRIGKAYLDEYFALTLSDELLEIRENNFYLMSPVNYARLVRCAKIREYKNGDLIVNQGDQGAHVRMVISGKLDVLRDGRLTYTLEEANFVSEAGLHVGLLLPGRMESCCAVVASTSARLLVWERTALVDLLHQNPDLLRALKAALSWDVIRKLKAQRRLLRTGVVDDHDSVEWTKRRDAMTRHRYAAILHSMVQHPVIMAELRLNLAKYRHVHHIDDEAHDEALSTLGWTRQEFERGYRDRSEDEEGIHEDVVYHRGLAWHVRNYLYRMIQ